MDYSDDFLNHQEFIGTEVKNLANKKKTPELHKSINTDKMKDWIGKIDYDKQLVNDSIEMLHVFGYKINFVDELDGKKVI